MTPRLSELEFVEPASQEEWHAWLEKHHGTSPGVWLAVGKKGGTRTSLTYDAAVEEAVSFGWIDSTVHALDDDRFRQLFTPRKPSSNWSPSNKARVDRLTAEGRMRPAGIAAVEVAQSNGSWNRLDDVEALIMPNDLADALASDEAAAEGFDRFAESEKKQLLYWISEAKRPETRARRIQSTVEAAAAGRYPP